jgi:hypothetical protein
MDLGPDSTLAQPHGWLAERIVRYPRISPALLDLDRPFAGIGLEPVCALTLCGGIEDALGITAKPTAAWGYPTVTVLAQGVRDELPACAGISDG